jgi:hypothetical protein
MSRATVPRKRDQFTNKPKERPFLVEGNAETSMIGGFPITNTKLSR